MEFELAREEKFELAEDDKFDAPDDLVGIHIPAEVVSGTCPRIPGKEEEMVWHAASEACDSERVSFVWSVDQGCVYFIAVRSADLVSAPGTWCPLAALLPGMPDARPGLACYLLEAPEESVLMVVGNGFIRVVRGSLAVMRSKAEREAASLGGVEIVRLAAIMGSLRPVAWRSLGLLDDRARRVAGRALVLSGVSAAVLSVGAWWAAMASFAVQEARHDLVRQEAATATARVVEQAAALVSSQARSELGALVGLNQDMIELGGVLERYEIADGQVSWTAVVPPSTTADRIQAMGARTLEVRDGMAVVVKGR